jgi:hypothetical protein
MQCNASLFDIIVSKCPTDCDRCVNKILNSKIYCKSDCHKKNYLAVVEGPAANAETEQPSSQSRDLTDNDS